MRGAVEHVEHGLAAAGPTPFVLTPYGGWFVLLVWFAGFLTLPIVYEVLSALFFPDGNGSMAGIVLVQVAQGLVGLWAIGTYGMAGPRQPIPEVLSSMRLTLEPFDGNPLRALTWGLTGYAVAIPAVVAYNYFVKRSRRLGLDLEDLSTTVLNILQLRGRSS